MNDTVRSNFRVLRRSLHTRAALVVAALALAAHVTVLGSGLVFDDHHSVRDNPALADLGNLWSALFDPRLFSGTQQAMYRPVVVVSLILDHALGRGAAWAFHLTDLLLHAVVSVLVYRLAVSLRVRPFGAWAAASWFAVHPLLTESLHLVSGRSDQLAAAGICVALILYVQGKESGASVRRVVALSAGCCAALVFACGAKVIAVVVPALLVGLELLWMVRDGRWSVRASVAALLRIAPVAVCVVVWLAVRRAALQAVAVPALPVVRVAEAVDVQVGGGRDLVTQLTTMFGEILPRFFAQVMVPLGLSIDPQNHYTAAWWSAPHLAGVTAVVGATSVGVWSARPWRKAATRERAAARIARLVGIALLWATALPWMLIPLNSPAAEHRMYVPMIGFALVAASVLQRPQLGPMRRVAFAGCGVALALGVVLSTRRGFDYRSDRSIWRATLACWSDAPHGLIGMGLAERDEARWCWQVGNREGADAAMARAREWFAAAATRWPRNRSALENLAEIELAMGERGAPYRALVVAETLIGHAPTNPFHRLLYARAACAVAKSHRAVGERERAAAWFDRGVESALYVLEIAEPKGLLFRTAADVRAEQGDLRAAVELLDRSVALGLDHDSVLLHRARLNLRLGDAAAVRHDLREVQRRDPFHPGLREFLHAAKPQ